MPHRDRAGACGTRRFHGAVLPQRRGREVPLPEVPGTAFGQSVTPGRGVEGATLRCTRGRPTPRGTEHPVAVEAVGLDKEPPDRPVLRCGAATPSSGCGTVPDLHIQTSVSGVFGAVAPVVSGDEGDATSPLTGTIGRQTIKQHHAPPWSLDDRADINDEDRDLERLLCCQGTFQALL